jgi:lysophospholipase L1-like esterase
MLKRIFFILLFFLALINVLLGVYGVSCILLTVSVYFSVLWLFIALIRYFVPDTEGSANAILLVVVVAGTLFTAEVILKYVVKYNLTYTERNGDFFYSSPYKQKELEMLIRKYVFQQQDLQVSVHQPNTTGVDRKPEFTYKHHFNKLGLRDKEPVKDSAAFTIVGLGDSFTEGVGAPADSTWLKSLEGYLDASNPGKHVQTINGGMNGSDPFAERMILEKRLLAYKPDVVIVAINKSDIDDVIIRGGNERFAGGSVQYRKGPWWEFIYQFSYIFRAFVHGVFHVNGMLLTNEQYKAETAIALQRIQACIQQDYERLAAQYGFRLMVVLHPLQRELETRQFPLAPLYEQISADSSLVAINLYDVFIQQIDELKFKDLYWQTDLHHNSEGYRLWAEVLERRIFLP